MALKYILKSFYKRINNLHIINNYNIYTALIVLTTTVNPRDLGRNS